MTAEETAPVRVADVIARTERLNERLAACGGSDVDVVAVTKGFGLDAVVAALEAGHHSLGENYAQELETKAHELDEGVGDVGPSWHFIGRLQRNKVRKIASLVTLWQSVDRLSLGAEIAKRSPGARVLVQANLSGEDQKGGAALETVDELVEDLDGLGLDVVGLMGVGPAGDPEASRRPFRSLVAAADRLGLSIRSMGMSGDLEIAVQEGATMVRIGTELFGPRPARR